MLHVKNIISAGEQILKQFYAKKQARDNLKRKLHKTEAELKSQREVNAELIQANDYLKQRIKMLETALSNKIIIKMQQI